MTLRVGSSAAVWRALEHALDRLCGAPYNPTRHLGALATLMLWVLLVSGVWLYALFDTSAEGAYRSIARLGENPHAIGEIMRSLHRYATDAFVLLVFGHLVREHATLTHAMLMHVQHDASRLLA